MWSIHRSLPSPIAPGLVAAEGRQIERANGSQGDAVWSNLVLEAWWLRERQGEKGLLIHIIKKEIYHFTLVWGGCTFDTLRTGAQLRE